MRENGGREGVGPAPPPPPGAAGHGASEGATWGIMDR